MPEDAASLQNLRDIVVPEPPPLWPPAPGVWVLLSVILAVVLALFLLWWRARQRNAYRRAGPALLEGARTSRDINIVLKRVALAAWPRPEVAPLYGDDWAAFLDESCARSRFSSLGTIDDAAEPTRELTRSARTWIRHHRAPSRARRPRVPGPRAVPPRPRRGSPVRTGSRSASRCRRR